MRRQYLFPACLSRLLWAALLVLLPGFPACASADQPTVAVRLSYVQGSVQILTGDQVQFSEAQINMPLLEGNRVQTGGDGQAELEFSDGSVARLTPNSSLQFTRLQLLANRTLDAEVEQLTGLAYYELNITEGQRFAVRFGAAAVRPIDNSIFRVNLDYAPEVAVFAGAVHLDGHGAFSVDLNQRQSARLDAKGAASYTQADAISPDSWDGWNQDRDREIAQEGEDQSAARASSGDSANPGWNDLDYYGDWYSVEGYGNVWTPADAGPEWDPYGYGAWANYPGYGFLWVSGYPWGWLPYSCGAWNYFDAFGWGWIPGGCGLGWQPIVTILNAPPGYHPPPKPHPGGHIGGAPIPIRRVGGSAGAGVHAEHTRVIHFDGRDIAPLPVLPIATAGGFDVENPARPVHVGVPAPIAGGIRPGWPPGLSMTPRTGAPPVGFRGSGIGSEPQTGVPGYRPPNALPPAARPPRPIYTPAPRLEAPRAEPAPHFSPPAAAHPH